MIALSNITAQTLAPGQSITFDNVILHTGCGECHRKNTPSVKLRANGVYDVHFNGNVASTTANEVIELAIQLGGTTLPETRMAQTLTANGDRANIGASTLIKNCCGDYDRITVTNVGTTTFIVGVNSSLTVKRVS